MKKTSLWQLFATFFKTGLFTFGGGYAMIAILQDELVEKKKWITNQDMLDLIVVAESTPGVIAVNAATSIGYKTRGVLGSIIATLGIVLPSFLIISVLSYLVAAFQSNVWYQSAFRGIQACVTVLVVNAFTKMFKQISRDAYNYIALAVAFVVAAFTEFNVIFLILAGAVGGLLVTLFKKKDDQSIVTQEQTVQQDTGNAPIKKSKLGSKIAIACVATVVVAAVVWLVVSYLRGDNTNIYIQLFCEYFKIGLFTIGGGYAMLPMVIQTVEKYGWLTNDQLYNFIGIAESTPGPFAINLATFVGTTVGNVEYGFWGGVLGAVISTFAVVLPSLVIIIIVSKVLERFKTSKWVQGALYGIRPVVVGLILSAMISIALNVVLPNVDLTNLSQASATPFNFVSLLLMCMFLPLSKLKIKGKKVHPIFMILLAAGLGVLLFGVLQIPG